MSDCVIVPSHTKLPVRRYCVSQHRACPKHVHYDPRKLCAASYKVNPLSSIRICKPSTFGVTIMKASFFRKESPVKCLCYRTLINSGGVIASDWIPVVDQVLLMTSVFLTYMVGVIPAEKSPFTSKQSIANDRMVPDETSVSVNDDDDEVNLKFAWEIVRKKLLDSLNIIENKGNLGSGVTESEQQRPASLFAIAEAPRFRLLLASFHRLKKEVSNVFGNSSTLVMFEPQVEFSQIIQKSCEHLCIDWLAEELSLKSSNFDMACLSILGEKLNVYDSIIQSVENLGKKDLYTDLIGILRSGSLRKDSCYDFDFFTRHGVSVLEDLVISLADGVASMYVELISVDGDMSDGINSLGLSLCSLSTRALQRLRNEVVLSQWLYQNMDSVASMYEDRFDLRTLESRIIQDSSKGEANKSSWWKNIGMLKSRSASSPLRFVVINCISVPVKRTKELRALTGWRYYYSLFLELFDISMPLVKTVVGKVSEAISFFLVCLIGRSLGLIYTGIRQSLRWK
ncbi:uncharacterized protein LOC141707595 isoform X2 [Apium graveolens]|uniref:uncharacterized protein LOC141707595 isoform X2 n=1 Tax=Apium graveolens TaxID=4045 RepID=UPI003D78B428